MNPYVKPIKRGTLKDCLNHDVLDGDIIFALTEDDRPFWGLIIDKESGWGNRYEGPNPQWGQYSVCHGWGNFPSSLAWAARFMVIDNCLSFGLKRPLIGDYERCYELWTQQHSNDDFSKYADELKSL